MNLETINLENISQITLDLSIPKITNVRCKQDDFNSRKLLITLTNNGEFFPIDETVTAYYKLCKPDGTSIYNEVTAITDDGNIFIDLTEQCTAYSGIAHSELQLIKAETENAPGQIISSMPFQVIVEKSVVDNDTITSSDEFDALNRTVLTAKAAIENATSIAEDLQNKLDSNYFLLTSEKGIANGIASLDANAQVPENELPEATCTNKGITQLTDSLSSTSTTTAATPNSVKQAYDKTLELSDSINANKPIWDDKYTKTEIDSMFAGSTLNDQAITYEEATTLTETVSGEKLPIAFGKIKKAIRELISHIGNTGKHIPSSSASQYGQYLQCTPSGAAWSNSLTNSISTINTNLSSKQDASTAITTSNIASQSVAYATSAGSANAVTWANVTGKPSTYTPVTHTHPYLPLTGGTLTGNLTIASGDLIVTNNDITLQSGILNLANKLSFIYSGSISVNSSSNMHLETPGGIYVNVDSAGVLRYNFTSSYFGPNDTEVANCGASSKRWSTVYGKNAFNSSSDRTLKHDIKLIKDDKRWHELFYKLKPSSFIFNNGDRVHVGAISQDVEEAMNEVGITAEEFGGFCKDIVYEYDYNEDGTPIEASKRAKLDENGNVKYEYSLRYAEFVFLCIQEIQNLKTELDEIKANTLS